MGLCSSPPPPQTPDYVGAAREQGAANVDAARTQGRINNPNVVNPYGTQTVTWDGDTPTLTQTLSPEQQRLLDQNNQTQYTLGRLGQQGADSLFGIVGKPLDFGGAPSEASAYTPGAPLSALNPSSLGRMPTAYSGAQGLPDMPQASEAIRQRVIDAMMSRGNDDFAAREAQQNADLVARGLRPGTAAYERERDSLNRARNDYRMQAELTAGDEANRAFGQDLSRRQQGYDEQTNDAQMIFNQLMGVRQQGASEQAQRFGQQGQSAELGMRGQAQQFSQQDALRRQAITEMLAQRQIPLNEITALMSGSQVSNPFSTPGYAQNSNVAPAPIFGATQAAGNQANNIYNAQVGTSNANTAAAGGLGAAAIGAMFF